MCKFIKSANFVSEYYQDDRNQICFVGRSNVGKSSLINSLANKKIAKTSSTPGKTQLVNFFDFKSIILVDLPGYGYAKTNKKKSELIQTLIFEYINYSKKIAGIFQLCNIDVITNQDFEICQELKKICSKNSIDYFLILTKLDKITLSQENIYVDKISNFLKVNKNLIITTSNKNKMNIKKIKLIIDKIICK